MCFGLWCGDGTEMYDARLAVTFGYMHAIGGAVYAVTYSCIGPNHRMYGFILRGWWNNAGLAIFCLCRSFGLFENSPIQLFWWCVVGIVVLNISVLICVKVKYLNGTEAKPFGYTKAQFKKWGLDLDLKEE